MVSDIVKVEAHRGVRIVVQRDYDGTFFYMTGNGLHAGRFASAEAAVEDARREIDRRRA